MLSQMPFEFRRMIVFSSSSAQEGVSPSTGLNPQNFVGNQFFIPSINAVTAMSPQPTLSTFGDFRQTPTMGLLAPVSPSATITFTASWESNATGTRAPANVIGYWLIDGIQIGNVFGPIDGSAVALTINTQTVSWNGGTGIPDGPHIVTCNFIDTNDTRTGWLAMNLTCLPLTFLLANSAFNNGAQRVPVSTLGGNHRPFPPEDCGPGVDFVQYQGTPA